MDAVKYKKLDEFASFLKDKGASEEKNKEFPEAIATYLKLVDVLLIMADSAPSYQDWVKSTTEAESRQKKIRSLIALAAIDQERAQTQTTQQEQH